MDYFIGGITCFGGTGGSYDPQQMRQTLIALLALPDTDDSQGEAKAFPLEIRILDAETNDEFGRETVAVEDSEDHSRQIIPTYRSIKASDCSLVRQPDEDAFYIVYPGELILAKERSLEDRLDWLLQNGMYDDALVELNVIRQHQQQDPLSTTNLLQVGERYLNVLMTSGRYEEAARMCDKLLPRTAEIWERWIYTFAESKQLKVRGKESVQILIQLFHILNAGHQTIRSH